ncbi:MAG: polysaccharide pyruvyl transferase CsaB [Candidatus Bipolaricaulota bacterium]|nr:polysaccharide pyruvyl transferase CsaB [Candidatus Bipolaricaulota bacterium]
MAPTLVIAGYYGFGNWGDEAALAVLIRALRSTLPQARLVVLSHDPSQTARIHNNTEAINRWNLFEIHRALSRASAFILGPGGLLQDATSTRSVLYYLGLLRWAQFYKLPTYLIGQGIGPLRSQRAEQWVAKTLQRARFVLVRDRVSYEWALAHGAQALLGEDLAVLLEPFTPVLPSPLRGRGARGEGSEGDERGRSSTADVRATLGLSLRPGLSPKNIKVLHRALRTLSTDFELVFLSFQADQDLAVLKELALAIPVVEARCPDDLLQVMQNVDVLLGMRLHSLVFALLSDVPFCALSYDPKIESFLRRVEEVCEYPVQWWSASETLNESALVSQILGISAQRAELRERLRQARTTLQTAAHHSLDETLRVIASDLRVR